MTAPWRDAVALFEQLWTAALDDTCTINTNAQGAGNYSKATRSYDGTPTLVYTGACLFRPAGAGSTEWGEQLVELVDYDLYLPHDAPVGLAPDQQVTVDAVGPPTSSALLVGQVLTVRAVRAADSFNARTVLGLQLNRGGG